MNGSDERCIVVFDSIHYVLAAERAFQQAGLWCDLVPTPRAVHSDCGMVLEVRAADWQLAGRVVATLTRPPQVAYRMCQGQYLAIPAGEPNASQP